MIFGVRLPSLSILSSSFIQVCGLCQSFTPFHGCIIFHCAMDPMLFIQSSVDGHLLVSLLTIRNSAAVDTYMCTGHRFSCFADERGNLPKGGTAHIACPQGKLSCMLIAWTLWTDPPGKTDLPGRTALSLSPGACGTPFFCGHHRRCPLPHCSVILG